MGSSQMLGLVLFLAGAADALMALFVIGPRVPDEGRRRILMLSLGASAVGMLALGLLFWMGVLGV